MANEILACRSWPARIFKKSSGALTCKAWRADRWLEQHFAPAPPRPFQRIAIHFVVVRENDHSAVGVLHLHMASLAVNSRKAQALQCGQDLSP